VRKNGNKKEKIHKIRKDKNRLQDGTQGKEAQIFYA